MDRLPFQTCYPQKTSKIFIGFACKSIWSWLIVKNHSDSFLEALKTTVHKQDAHTSLPLAVTGSQPFPAETG